MASVKPEPVDGPGALVDDVDAVDSKANADQHGYLQRLVSSASSPDLLEKGVGIGVQVLESLKRPLEAAGLQASGAQWLKAISELETLAKPTRTIVGVVGNTGAGKSSVISAVLDEERLLPTNCMKACTASPTEISYNYSENPDELYRAEDLRGLYTDLLDGNGAVSRECANQDSDAGVAYANIKAVYPRLTKEGIERSTPEGLASQVAVRQVLGAVRKLRATTAASLYRQLQEYVESKEKNTEKRIEYWPLIKVVRIHTKAAALATGACLVDLLGVQNSNAARAAVAANYMKACTGLWIVAPITRAVDDKTAKSLLGDSFRRQLKYDGTYPAVTFICSKTDDISVTEAAESLGIDEEISESWAKTEEISDEVRKLKSDIGDLRDERDACGDLIDKIEQDWDKWEALGSKLAGGATVYAPAPNSPSKKRKRQARPLGSRKNLNSSDIDSDFSDSDGSSSNNKENQGRPVEDREPLTADEIEAKLASLKAEKKEVRARKKEAEDKARAIRETIKELGTEKDMILAELKAICIQGKKEYSRRAIKQDFAMGIKDGRAFQKLSGRLEKDDFNAAGFQSVEETEIPQLQAHAKKLTEAGRAVSSRRFLNDLLQLLNSMTMWASDDGTGSSLTDAERAREDTRLRKQLLKLEQNLETALRGCMTSVKQVLTEHIFSSFDRYVPMAADGAVPTATQWGAPRAMGGLVWSTYKATCRRNGVFAGASEARDFNAELFDPVSKHLASGWGRAFQRRLPSSLDDFLRTIKVHLEKFHAEATERAKARGTHYNGLHMLGQQLQAHSQRAADVRGAVLALAQEMQREANRGFTPVIQDEMTPAYEGCVEERGPGSYMRMKSLMIRHVDSRKAVMFRNATDLVQRQLEVDLCNRIREALETHVQELKSRLARDYLSALVGVDVSAIGLGPSLVELMLRGEILPLLPKIDGCFAELFGGGVGREEKGGVTEEAGVDDSSDGKEDGDDDGDGDFATPEQQLATEDEAVAVKGEQE
ncbi:hypothetical protein N658DRAFT_516763 [Parathielavia hyrcaniae]|uniref:Nuclear GTPase SLIP-GC n=1 Tax=Parathielavia hyrcaniae TaxID=113614 RepID=A0AAN6Q0X8_9PEZI|nr:hypothetical protein N658DRAFT_516763 [Parathielavia hyrcaniae]